MEISLVALLPLLFQIHRQLSRNHGFQIVGLRQPFRFHVIVHHEQRVFQISTGKAIRLHFVQIAVSNAVSKQRA